MVSSTAIQMRDSKLALCRRQIQQCVMLAELWNTRAIVANGIPAADRTNHVTQDPVKCVEIAATHNQRFAHLIEVEDALVRDDLTGWERLTRTPI